MRSSGTSTARITFTAAPGAERHDPRRHDGFYLSDRSWVTINGFNIIDTTGYGLAVNRSSHITLSNNHVSFSGQPVSGFTKYGIRLNAVTDSLVSHNTVDHNTNAGIGLVSESTRNWWWATSASETPRATSAPPPASTSTTRPETRWPRTSATTTRTRGSTSTPGSTDMPRLRQRHLQQRRPRHRRLVRPANATIVANTVYHNVTAGINVEGGSTGATLANNISVDNGIDSPRTHERHPRRARVDRGHHDGLRPGQSDHARHAADLELASSYKTLAAFQAASGQEAHGLRGRPALGGSDQRRLPAAGRLAGDRLGRLGRRSGQPVTDVYGDPRVDDPATPEHRRRADGRTTTAAPSSTGRKRRRSAKRSALRTGAPHLTHGASGCHGE